MTIIVFGLSPKITPVEIREKFVLSYERKIEVLARLKDTPPIMEAAILSDEASFEIYARPSIDPRAGFLAVEEHIRTELCPYGLSSNMFFRLEGKGAIQHLFRLVCGLNSFGNSNSRILERVQEAYRISKEAGASGKITEALFHRALLISKLFRTQEKNLAGDGVAHDLKEAEELVRARADEFYKWVVSLRARVPTAPVLKEPVYAASDRLP